MLKYIIIAESDGQEVAFFCLGQTKHLELALMAQSYKQGRKLVSAGFVEFAGGEATTHGYSDSLDLHPRDEDARFLTVFARHTAMVAAVSMPA